MLQPELACVLYMHCNMTCNVRDNAYLVCLSHKVVRVYQRRNPGQTQNVNNSNITLQSSQNLTPLSLSPTLSNPPPLFLSSSSYNSLTKSDPNSAQVKIFSFLTFFIFERIFSTISFVREETP